MSKVQSSGSISRDKFQSKLVFILKYATLALLLINILWSFVFLLPDWRHLSKMATKSEQNDPPNKVFVFFFIMSLIVQIAMLFPVYYELLYLVLACTVFHFVSVLGLFVFADSVWLKVIDATLGIFIIKLSLFYAIELNSFILKRDIRAGLYKRPRRRTRRRRKKVKAVTQAGSPLEEGKTKEEKKVNCQSSSEPGSGVPSPSSSTPPQMSTSPSDGITATTSTLEHAQQTGSTTNTGSRQSPTDTSTPNE